MSAEVEFFHDRISHILIEGMPIRVLEVDLRDTSREAATRFKAGEVAACALSQALIASALLAGHIKGDERLTFQMIGRGHLGSLFAECSADGDLRAMAQYPEADALGQSLEERVSKALGEGNVFVIKSTAEREVYRGTAPFAHTDVAGALEVYLEVSEQVASEVWISTTQEGAEILTARGLLIQALGGAPRGDFEKLKERLPRVSIAAALRSGESVAKILEGLFPDAVINEVEARPLRFRCTCSSERVLAMILSLGDAEVEDMLEKDGQAEVTCEFCRTRYEVGAPQLRHLLTLLRRGPSDPGSS